ncbi:MAG: hypothetical protein IJJ33_03700 [Victivallales bacterium]|nr:hypothetical protein [Victivallales bacterium]
MADHRTKEIETTQGTVTVRAMKHKDWREFMAITRKVQKEIEEGNLEHEGDVEGFLLRFADADQAKLDEMERWEIMDIIAAVRDLSVNGSAKN